MARVVPWQRLDQRAGHRVAGDEDQVDLVRSIVCHTSSGRTSAPGPSVGRRTGASARRLRAPCISGGSGKRIIGGFSAAALDWSYSSSTARRCKVDAAAEHPPEVLVAPHHALGEAGGAAGVDDVEVVGAALAEVALGRPCCQRRVELDAAVTPVVVVAAVLDRPRWS